MTSNFSRSDAEAELKDTAAEASYHSSGDVLNSANPEDKYAHGQGDRKGSVIDANTTLPSTNTTISGAYSIGNTSTANVADNYDNKFNTPDSHMVGSGSRTVQSMPEQVQDLGTTVQTTQTTHNIVTEPTQSAYITPSNTSYVTGSAGQVHTSTLSSDHQTSTETSDNQTSTSASASSHPHHGVIGQNTTVTPSAGTAYNVNSASGTSVGLAAMGIPHSTKPTTRARESTAEGHAVSDSHHNSTTDAGDHEPSSPEQKQGLMSKIKHAFHK